MTVLDYFVIVVIGASLVLGLVRGIVRASITLLACIVGLLAAGYLYPYVGAAVKPVVSSKLAADFVGFILIFMAVLIVGMVVSKLLRRALTSMRLGWVDHLMGAGFGLVRGWLMCSALYLALTAFPIRLEAVEQAKLSPLLLEGTRVIAYLTSPEVRGRFQDGYGTVGRARAEDSKGKQQ
jgi:membrane protein required for colicin V production